MAPCFSLTASLDSPPVHQSIAACLMVSSERGSLPAEPRRKPQPLVLEEMVPDARASNVVAMSKNFMVIREKKKEKKGEETCGRRSSSRVVLEKKDGTLSRRILQDSSFPCGLRFFSLSPDFSRQNGVKLILIPFFENYERNYDSTLGRCK